MSERIKTIKYTKLTKTAHDLEKAHSDDAGIDFYTDRAYVLNGQTTKVISTGISMAIPKGWYGQIGDRSGVASRTALKVKAGVIDAGYRGEVQIIMANISSYPHKIEKGEKIAQMTILPVPKIKLVSVDSLDDTERGEDGLGSTD